MRPAESSRVGGLAAVLVATMLLPARSQEPGPPKSGVKPSVLSLPTGPGSIEGLGKAFQPDVNTGGASYSVEIEVPPGVAGHQPELILGYDSHAGDGPLGIGWSLGLPRIARQTEKGMPRYGPDDRDTFVYGGEELVPLSDDTYRCENESAFIRFERWSPDGLGTRLAWVGTLPDGRRYEFGNSSAERVSVPGRPDGAFENIFSWSLSTFVDTSGNTIRYRYARYDDSPGQLYLSEIEYARSGSHHHRVSLSYEARPDPFSDYHAGFEVRCSRRLRDIVVSTDGRTVRRYVLGYDPDPSLDEASPGPIEAGPRQLCRITQHGRIGDGTDYLPPLRFAYTHSRLGPDKAKGMGPPSAAIATGFRKVNGGRNFLRFGPAHTASIDIDADGLPDLARISHHLDSEPLRWAN